MSSFYHATVAWKLPVGVQDFAQLREGGFLYADKTPLIHRLATTGLAYFLSRPRRFGKSLLLSTIKELFEGKEPLFRGLWIHDHWDWTRRHPVVLLSLGTGGYQERGAARSIFTIQVDAEAERHQVALRVHEPAQRFAELLRRLSERGPRPVVLIDEYDKPVLQVLEAPGHEAVLAENLAALRAFYSCLKDAAPEFLLLTGVSRLAKASVFSDMNQVSDLTLAPDYATICGFTHHELAAVFAEPLRQMAARQQIGVPALLETFRDRYNGFGFAPGAETVYNPFSTAKCLFDGVFGDYWTETGTPEFLVRLMVSTGVTLAQVDGVSIPASALSSLDPLHPEALPLLLQTGYLTIIGQVDGNLTLGFPNQEVRSAFVEHLLAVATGSGPAEMAPRAQAMGKALRAGDLERFLSEMRWVFSTIPYQLDDATEARYHGLFHAMAMLACCPPGLVLAETANALGRSDLVVDLPEASWIFEFKRDTDPEAALAQIRRKEYAHPWRGRGKPVHLIGVTFSSATRNIVSWQHNQSQDGG